MVFRPYPVLTLAAAAILAVLVWLGFWQLSRAEWKRDLIADQQATLNAQPIPLRDALCGAEDPARFLVVARSEVEALAPPVSDGKTQVIRMFGRGPDGEPGWRRLTLIGPPACTGASPLPMLAELSFEPLQTSDYPSGELRTVDRLVLSEWPAKGAFATFNDIANNDWHWFDGAALAEALGAPALDQTRYLSASTNLPAHLRTPPAQHLGYAATWFGMALALLVVYAAFHARAGRLRLGKASTGRT